MTRRRSTGLALRRLLPIVLVGISVARCECEPPENVSTLEGVLVPDRTTLDFGGVFVGADDDAFVRLQNLGGADVTFTSAVVGGGPFSLETPAPVPLAPEGTTDVIVRFAPTSVGGASGTLTLVSDAENAPSLVITLVGEGREALPCDDGNPCTEDLFDAILGACVHAAIEGTCDDGSACTTNDVCVSGTCLGEAIVCNDDDPCTLDTCVSDAGCLFLPDTSVCDDGNPCTDDICVSDGNCTWVDKQDNTLCTDVFTCASISLCQAGACVDFPVPDGAPCSDGDLCTVSDSCQGGVCVGVESDVPPGVGAVLPLALPLDYGSLVAVRTETHLFQVAPGFLSAFDVSDPSALTLVGHLPLPGAYREETMAAFDDGRVVAVLPVEERVLVVDVNETDGLHVVAEIPLPQSTSTGYATGAISLGDRIVFLYGGALYLLDDALTLTLFGGYPDDPDGLGGTPSRALLYHRTPLSPFATTRVLDLTGPAPVELAVLPYACTHVHDDGALIACLTYRDISNQILSRYTVFDGAALAAGETEPLSEKPRAFSRPNNRLLLVDGYLLLVDAQNSTLALVDPVTDGVVVTAPFRGSSVWVLDDQTLISNDGQWIKLEPTGSPGAAFVEVVRTDLGAVAAHLPASRDDNESLWRVGRSSVARVAIDDLSIDPTHVLTLPVVASDSYRSFSLIRLPTNDGPVGTSVPLGGGHYSPMVPLNVAFGPEGLTAMRANEILMGRPYAVGGGIVIGDPQPTENTWVIRQLDSGFSGAGSLTALSSIPMDSLFDDDDGIGIPNPRITLSRDGRRAIIADTKSTFDFESSEVTHTARFAVVDLDDPTTPRIGGVPVAPGLVYDLGTLDYVTTTSLGIIEVATGFLVEHDHVFLSWTSTETDDEYLAVVVDARNPLAPALVASGRVLTSTGFVGPQNVFPYFATPTGRVFFGRGFYGPEASYIASVDLGGAESGVPVAPDPEDVVMVPAIPFAARMVGDALVVEGQGYLGTISPPCDP